MQKATEGGQSRGFQLPQTAPAAADLPMQVLPQGLGQHLGRLRQVEKPCLHIGKRDTAVVRPGRVVPGCLSSAPAPFGGTAAVAQQEESGKRSRGYSRLYSILVNARGGTMCRGSSEARYSTCNVTRRETMEGV